MISPPVLFLIVPVILLSLAFAYPMFVLLSAGLAEDLTESFWFDPNLWRVSAFTYFQAFVSAVLSGVLGIWAAVTVADQRFPGRTLLWQGALVCFSLPAILVVLSLMSFWGAFADLPVIFGWPAVLLAHVFFNFPVYLKNVGTALRELDRTEEKIALSLGASRSRCFFTITLRKLWPSIRSSFFLTFLYCAGSFMVILLLGGGPRFTTLEAAIYQAIKVELNLPFAARLAILQFVGSLLVYLVLATLPGPSTPRSSLFFYPMYFPQSPAFRWLWLGALAVTLFFVAAGPLGALVIGGLKGLTLVPPTEWILPLTFTVQLAGLVAFLSVVIAFGLAYAEARSPWRSLKLFLGYVGNLPLSVSAIVMTLGLLLAYPLWIGTMRGSWLPIALVQAVSALPLVFRLLRDGFERIPESSVRIAQALGAGPWRRLFLVELPAMKGALLTATVAAVAYSAGEVGAILIFLSEGLTTLPLEIYRNLGQYRFEGAHALGVILLFLMLSLMAILGRGERWRI